MRIITLFFLCFFISNQTQAQGPIPGFNFCWEIEGCGLNAPGWCDYKLYWDTCDPALEFDLIIDITYSNGFNNKYDMDEDTPAYIEGAYNSALLFPTEISFIFSVEGETTVVYDLDPLDEDFACSDDWETEGCCETDFFLELCPVYNCDPCEDSWAFVCAMGTLPDGTTEQLANINLDYGINWINPNVSDGQCATFGIVSGNTTLEAEIIDLVGCSHIVTLDVSCPLLRGKDNSDEESEILTTEQVSISPNPATEHLIITNPSGLNLNVEIFNLNGQVVKVNKITKTTTINIDDLPTGIYTTKISDLGTAKTLSIEQIVIK